jgi:hypothetical protein
MKFKEYLENLNKLAKENPEFLDFEVVSAADDEGNSYDTVSYGPGVGHFDSDESEFVPTSQLREWDLDESSLNAICIN